MFRLTLFCQAALATYVRDITDSPVNIRTADPSAASVAACFASIRPGSFTSVSDFRRCFPLDKLLSANPSLFLSDGLVDPIEQLANDLEVTRAEAATNFIAHNYHEIDKALAKILRSTNDAVVAAILIDPIGATDASLLSPIKALLFDYLQVRRRRCLLDHLPDVFADPTVYDKYFTPIEGYRVNPKEELGYTAILPDDPMAQLLDDHGGSVRQEVFNGLIWLRVEAFLHPRDTLIDVRRGCAVTVNPLFEFGGFVGVLKWLSLVRGGLALIWRENSVEPLSLPASDFQVFADRSHVVSLDGRFMLPTDLSAPFIATWLSVPLDINLLLRKEGHHAYSVLGDDGIFAVVSKQGLIRASRFCDVLSQELVEAIGRPLPALQSKLLVHRDDITAVSLLVNRMHARLANEAWVMAMELCARFDLKSRDELIAFIISVTKGYRPVGIELCLPMRFLPLEELRRKSLSRRGLQLAVLRHRAHSTVKGLCNYPFFAIIGHAVGWFTLFATLKACELSFTHGFSFDSIIEDVCVCISTIILETLSSETGSF